MWRIILVLSICLLAAACSPADVAPPEGAVRPDQIEAVERATAELAEQLGLETGEIRVVRVEDAEWTDSCLGLGGANESCLQVITPGYKITLGARGAQYVYRTDETGSAVRLEQIAQ